MSQRIATVTKWDTYVGEVVYDDSGEVRPVHCGNLRCPIRGAVCPGPGPGPAGELKVGDKVRDVTNGLPESGRVFEIVK